MKFVQSFWSKPILDVKNKNKWSFRHNGGFPNAFLFYSAWIYSCLSIKKYYPNLHLVTDDFGMFVFKEELKLPYASFSSNLNELENYHENLWALGKLYTYSLQKEPFCHIDGDVFLFGPVLDPILTAPVFCQSFNYDFEQYAEIHPYVHNHFTKVPKEFSTDKEGTLKLINAGVIGGSDLETFQHYTDKAFELINKNTDKIGDISSSIFNLYYEQFLLSNIISLKDIEVATLFYKSDNELDLAAFHNIPHHTEYVHLLSHLKLSTAYMEQIVVRLQIEYPEFYNRLLGFSKMNGL
nr:DUF6734 family protein [uncultured Allomuricauda sp.]